MNSLTKSQIEKIKPRFESKFKKTNGCWIWKGSFSAKGYGFFHIGPKQKRRNYHAHRISYLIYIGEIPTNFCIMHSCDNPPCVNPSHLKAGTFFENSNDMVSKNRHRYGSRHKNSKITEKEVVLIRKDYTGKFGNIMYLSRKFGIDKAQIRRIIDKKSWKHI